MNLYDNYNSYFIKTIDNVYIPVKPFNMNTYPLRINL